MHMVEVIKNSIKIQLAIHTHPSPRAIEAPKREQLKLVVAIFLVIRSLT